MAHAPVDILKIVPTHLAALLDIPDALSLLPRRALILGGDVLPWRQTERIHALAAGCRIFNHYGPTEATVGACMTETLAALCTRDGQTGQARPPPAGGRDGNDDADGTK